MFNNFYRDKKVFVTGGAGFKGSWLIKWLDYMGATTQSYDIAHNPLQDITHKEMLFHHITTFKPDVIFSSAAQSTVIDGYKYPQMTFETNIIGTVNILESIKALNKKISVVNIITDKIFRVGEDKPFKETDVREGYDPYAVSKVCASMITDSYITLYKDNPNIKIASVNAGNVIGGGDWGKYRIVTDIVNSIINNKELEIRNPSAIRPFTFVLDTLSGYMLLAQKLYEDKSFEGSWNFGTDEAITVQGLLTLFREYWKPIQYKIVDAMYHETSILKLDSTKAKTLLGWKPLYNIGQTVQNTVEWYREYYENNKDITLQQIEEYEKNFY